MRYLGTCKFWKIDKGWGFVTPDSPGPDIFIHISGLVGRDRLWGGEKISFDIAENPKTGKQCGKNVTVVEQPKAVKFGT